MNEVIGQSFSGLDFLTWLNAAVAISIVCKTDMQFLRLEMAPVTLIVLTDLVQRSVVSGNGAPFSAAHIIVHDVNPVGGTLEALCKFFRIEMGRIKGCSEPGLTLRAAGKGTPEGFHHLNVKVWCDCLFPVQFNTVIIISLYKSSGHMGIVFPAETVLGNVYECTARE